MGSNPGYLLKSFLLYTQQFKKIQFEFSRNHNLKKKCLLMKLKRVEIANVNSERLFKHCVRIQGELLGFSSSRAIDDKRPAKFVSSTTPPSLCLAAYYNYCILCYTEPRRVVSSVLKQQQLRRRRRCNGGGSRRGRVYPPAAAHS